MNKSNIIGIDLGKNVFHICVMNSVGKVLSRKKCNRATLQEYVLTKCEGSRIAMEACGGSQYWARIFVEQGYEVGIISGQFVKPFVKSQKNDMLDAEAICEAGLRPQMRYVSLRTEHQQDIQNLHRIRERLVKQRTGLSNEIRGLLLEYGVVVSKGVPKLRKELLVKLEEQKSIQSELWTRTFLRLYEEFQQLDKSIEEVEEELQVISRTDETCKRLLEIPGVGVLTATAMVGAVGNAKVFQNGRQFAAWLGIVPHQYSTGGKSNLGSITKKGDKYLRKLLVHGARAIGAAAERKSNHKDPLKRMLSRDQRWLLTVASRRGGNRAAVAMANKNARKVWQVLRGETFKTSEELIRDLAA